MRTKSILLVFLFSFLNFACKEEPLPKPTGYFRIDLPEKEYRQIDQIPFPFKFQLPQYGAVNLNRTKTDSNFLNIDFARFEARIHLSYSPVDTNLNRLLEDSRELVYKHVVKAEDISEHLIVNKESSVFGTYYEIDGNTASGSQFYLTDSNKHFLRGALYFYAEPNFDSIAPVQAFLKEDIEKMITTLKWKQ